MLHAAQRASSCDTSYSPHPVTSEPSWTPKHFAVAPNTLALPQVGPVSVAQLLISAGENFDRFRNEAAFARLCGVAPIPVSSGKSPRMRPNR